MDDKLRKWCRANWDKVPELVRNDCLNHLEGWITPAIIVDWKKQGYDRHDGTFHHFGGGMQIRNRLRDMLTDGELPEVEFDPDNNPYGPSKNWDDYYTGALDEFLERHNDDGSKK